MSLGGVNPFQKSAAQKLQKPAQSLVKAGDTNKDGKLSQAETKQLGQQSKANPDQFKKDFGINAKQLEQLQKLGDNKKFGQNAGKDNQLGAQELAAALAGGNGLGQKLNVQG